jgi:predicted DNA repair protein MutK
VRTDFILSAEIIVITLGTVGDAPFVTQVAVLVGIALLMTVGVYGLVAGIVKLDDAGLYLSRREGDAMADLIQRRIGAGILGAAPLLMKGLSVAGTAAMFLVGGGILAHGIPGLHHWIDDVLDAVEMPGGLGRVLRVALSLVLDAVLGIVAGAVVLAVVSGVQRVTRRRAAKR